MMRWWQCQRMTTTTTTSAHRFLRNNILYTRSNLLSLSMWSLSLSTSTTYASTDIWMCGIVLDSVYRISKLKSKSKPKRNKKKNERRMFFFSKRNENKRNGQKRKKNEIAQRPWQCAGDGRRRLYRLTIALSFIICINDSTPIKIDFFLSPNEQTHTCHSYTRILLNMSIDCMECYTDRLDICTYPIDT